MKRFFKWLFSFSTLTSLILGGLLSWNIQQYKNQNKIVKTANNNFENIVNKFDKLKELRTAIWELDSVQNVRIIELRDIVKELKNKHN